MAVGMVTTRLGASDLLQHVMSEGDQSVQGLMVKLVLSQSGHVTENLICTTVQHQALAKSRRPNDRNTVKNSNQQ